MRWCPTIYFLDGLLLNNNKLTVTRRVVERIIEQVAVLFNVGDDGSWI